MDPAPAPPRRTSEFEQLITPEKVAGILEYTNIYPFATSADIEQMVTDAHCLKNAAVCVPESGFLAAKNTLQELRSVVGLSIMVGSETPYRITERVKSLIVRGAAEIECVAPPGLLRAGDIAGYEHPLHELLRTVSYFTKDKGKNTVKITPENAYLREEEIQRGTRIIATLAGQFPKIRTYVGASTGLAHPAFGPFPERTAFTSLEEVALMREAITEVTKEKYTVGIKAFVDERQNRSDTLCFMAIAGCINGGGALTQDYKDLLRIGTTSPRSLLEQRPD